MLQKVDQLFMAEGREIDSFIWQTFFHAYHYNTSEYKSLRWSSFDL